MKRTDRKLFHRLGSGFVPDTAAGWGCLFLAILVIAPAGMLASTTESILMRVTAIAIAIATFVALMMFARKYS